MILLTLLFGCFLCATASDQTHNPAHWWTDPAPLPTIDPSQCDMYYGEYEWCKFGVDQGIKTIKATNTMLLDIPDYCFALGSSWGDIQRACGFDKNGPPKSISQPTPPHAAPLALRTSEGDTYDENLKRDPQCDVEDSSPFCWSKRDYAENTEDSKHGPPCDIEDMSPFCLWKRAEHEGVETDFESEIEKRDQRCDTGFHFLTAYHDTYHYFFCCPLASDRLLLPENYLVAPKCCMKGDKTCDVDAVDSLDGCRTGEVTQYGGVIGCRSKKIKRAADPGHTGISAGHDPVTSLGDPNFPVTSIPTAPPDHGQYCKLEGCPDGQVTSYYLGRFCQCVPAPPPTPTTVQVHGDVTGFISDVVGRAPEPTRRPSSFWTHTKGKPSGTTTTTVTITPAAKLAGKLS